MKKFYFYLVFMLTLMLTSSCSTFGQVYYDDYDGVVSYSVVVRDGIPYYIDNVLSYYYYNGMYYYPYMWNNHWFVHPFDRPQPRGFVYRPNHNFRPNGGMRGGIGMRPNVGMQQRGGQQPRQGMQGGQQQRQGTQNMRPSSSRSTIGGSQMRQSTPSMGGTRSGGISMGGNRGGMSMGGSRGGGRGGR